MKKSFLKTVFAAAAFCVCIFLMPARSFAGEIYIDRVLSYGMSGDDVLAVQQALYDLGYLSAAPDGIYGYYTEAAVNDFQWYNGLQYPDGKAGNWTVAKLNEALQYLEAKYDASDDQQISAGRVLSYGMNGSDVLEVQKQLYDLGYLDVEPDGSFGYYTQNAVLEFQLNNGLSAPDGKVGEWTRWKLSSDPVPKSCSNSASAYITLDRILEYGMSGDDVLAVQQRLYDLGYLTAWPDGVFGTMTERAVYNFQKANGCSFLDGRVGDWTAGALNSDPYTKAEADALGLLDGAVSYVADNSIYGRAAGLSEFSYNDGQLVLFAGDSFLDERYYFTNFYSSYFYGMNAYSVALYATTITQWMDYIQYFYEYQPKAIVISVGNNDVYNYGGSVSKVSSNLESLFAQMRANMPYTQIYWWNIAPRTYVGRDTAVSQINKIIADYASLDPYLTVVDAESVMTNQYGRADQAMYQDSIHPSFAAYDRLVNKTYEAGLTVTPISWN